MSASFSPDADRVSVEDDRVVRPACPWAPTIHALLGYLTAEGFDAVPNPIGIADGVETLGFIPGEWGQAGWAAFERRCALFVRQRASSDA
jgi:hypothetical protein